VVDDEPAGRSQASVSQAGTVAVAGQDEQPVAFGRGDDLPLDAPGAPAGCTAGPAVRPQRVAAPRRRRRRPGPGGPGAQVAPRVRSRGCSSRRGRRPPTAGTGTRPDPTVCPAGRCPVVPAAAHLPRPGLRGGAGRRGRHRDQRPFRYRQVAAARGLARLDEVRRAGVVPHPVPDGPQPAEPALGRQPRGRVQGREDQVAGAVPSTPTSAGTWPRPSEPASRRRSAATWQRSRNTCAAPTNRLGRRHGQDGPGDLGSVSGEPGSLVGAVSALSSAPGAHREHP
jgi:hypothetical protein